MRAVIVAALIVAAFLAGMVASDLFGPTCPSEDSCYPDYHNGRWVIVEGERP